MKQVIIEIDDATAERLDRVAPGRSRQRSAFIRAAIRRALDDEAERQMEAAYREMPDSAEASAFDPDEWETAPARRGRRR